MMKFNCDPDVIFGDSPKEGDKVYIDFREPIYTGGEIIGVVGRVTSDEIVVNKRVYRWHEVEHLEVIQDDGTETPT